MDDPKKRQAIQRYFQSRPSLKAAIFLGAFAIIALLMGSIEWALALAFASTIACMPWYFDRSARPSDEQVDRWLQEDLADAAQKAQRKLGFADEQEIDQTLVVIGPVGTSEDGRAKIQTGADGRLRFSLRNVLVLVITERFLGTLRYKFDSCTGNSYELSARDIGYQHIVEVEVREKLEIAKSGEEALAAHQGRRIVYGQLFRLALTSGGGFSFPTRAWDEAKPENAFEPPGTPLEHVTAALRSLVREHGALRT